MGERAGAGGQGRGRGVRAVITVGLAAAGLAAWAFWPGAPAPAASVTGVPVRTGQVVRADVAARQVVPGTLGYRGSYSVVNELPGGIITWTPPAGSEVRRGRALYRLADQPAELLIGRIPAWRPFQPGMTPGPDVRELERNLVALRLDPGHAMTVDDQFTWATAAAIDRWQLRLGMAETGAIALGQVVFLPEAARVASIAAAPGQPIAPGSVVLQLTSTVPAVSVAMPVGQAVVAPGDHVIVTLPDGTTTVPGVVAAVSRVASVVSPANPGESPGPATIPVTVRLGRSAAVSGLDQAPVQVTVTELEHRGVLAVPVTALLARPGGGYAVQLASAGRPVVPVSTGLFDEATGLVEVSGTGLAAGSAVVVAAG